MLLELIRKDIRLNRLPISGVLVGLVLPFVISATMFLWDRGNSDQPLAFVWSGILIWGAIIAACFSVLSLAALSGNIIASERAERSAEFLAYLPPSRSLIFTSKLVVVAVAGALVGWIILVAVAGARVLAGDDGPPGSLGSGGNLFGVIAAADFLITGTGVWFSARGRSPGLCAVLALLSPVAVQIVILTIQVQTEWPDQESYSHVFIVSCLAIGSVALALAYGYFVRRVEP